MDREETTIYEVLYRIREGTFYDDYDWASGPALRAMDRIEGMKSVLLDIVNGSHVGKSGAPVMRSKYANYSANHYHIARALLDKENDIA